MCCEGCCRKKLSALSSFTLSSRAQPPGFGGAVEGPAFAGASLRLLGFDSPWPLSSSRLSWCVNGSGSLIHAYPAPRCWSRFSAPALLALFGFKLQCVHRMTHQEVGTGRLFQITRDRVPLAGRLRIAQRAALGKLVAINPSPGQGRVHPNTNRGSYSTPDLRSSVINSCSKLHLAWCASWPAM